MLSCKKVTLRVGVVGFHSTRVSRERRIYSITTSRSAWNCLRLCRSTEVRVYLSFQRAETRTAALSWCLRQSRGEVCWPLCMLHRRKELFRSEKARWGKMGWDGSFLLRFLVLPWPAAKIMWMSHYFAVYLHLTWVCRATNGFGI